MKITDISIGQKVTFEVYPSAQFGYSFKDVTIAAFIDASIAMSLGTDLIALHQNVYPSLPAGTPDDPMQYSYVMVKNYNNESTILGIPWIRESTIVVNSGSTLTLVFQDIDERRKDRIIEGCLRNNERPTHVTFE